MHKIMNENVIKVFEMLGVEPNEEFKIKDECPDVLHFYKIDENLNVFFKVNSYWEKSCIELTDFLTGKLQIIKHKPIELNKLTLFDELLNRVGKNLSEIRSVLVSDKIDENTFYKLKEYISGYIKQIENDKKFATKIGFDYNEYVDEFTTDIFGLLLIQNYIEDSSIKEIIFEPSNVYVKRNDKLELTPLKFKNYENLIHKLLTAFNLTKQANTYVDISMDFFTKDVKIVIKKN